MMRSNESFAHTSPFLAQSRCLQRRFAGRGGRFEDGEAIVLRFINKAVVREILGDNFLITVDDVIRDNQNVEYVSSE